MYRLFGRILRHVSRRTIHAAGLVVLIVLVVFFGATRTQVGRDELSRQIEKTFNASFDGELQIGKLSGNLLYTLFASDVTLKDSNGNTVVSADSVVIRPRWLDLLQRTFSVESISVYRPVIEVVFDGTGSTNLATVFSGGKADSALGSSDWAFRSAVLNIYDGRIVTRNTGSPPHAVVNKSVFDFTNATLTDLELDARVDWESIPRQLDVFSFSGRLSDPALFISGGQSQVVIKDDRFQVTDLEVEVGASSFSLTGFVGLPENASSTIYDVPFLLDLEPSHVSFYELRTLFPVLPLSGFASLSAHVQGPISDLTVSWIRLEAPGARASMEGTVVGLPDSASFDLSYNSTFMGMDQLQEWLPDWPVKRTLLLDSLGVNALGQGTVHFGSAALRLNVTAEVDIESGESLLSSTILLDGDAGDSLSWRLGLDTENFNLSRWSGDASLVSNLNLTASGSGVGISAKKLVGNVQVELQDSWFRNTSIPGLLLSANSSSGILNVDARLQQKRGRLRLEGQGGFNSTSDPWSCTLSGTQTDLGPLSGIDSLRTALNFVSNVRGSGQTLHDLAVEARVAIDSSSVVLGLARSTIPPHVVEVAIQAEREKSPLISVRSDILDADLSGSFDLPSILSFANAWKHVLVRAINNDLNKPLYGPRAREAVAMDLESTVLLAQAEQALGEAGLSRISIHADFAFRRPDIISRYWPSFPRFDVRGRGLLDIEGDLNRFNSRLAVTADSATLTSLKAINFVLESSLSASQSNEKPTQIEFDLTANADSIRSGGQIVRAPVLDIQMKDRKGTVVFSAPGVGRIDSVQAGVSMAFLDDRNEIVLDHLRILGGNSFWEISERPTLAIYSDAIVANDIILRQYDPSGTTGQQIRMLGTLSNQSRDTLQVRADRVLIHEISDFMNLKPDFGGLLDARLAITGGGARPVVAGHIDIVNLSLDRRILGNFSIQSRLIPGSRNVDLSVIMSRADTTGPALIPGTQLVASFVENAFTISGTLRLPGALLTGEKDPGALDLDVNLDRADIFFLEYAFNETKNVSGYASGGGRIGGSFRTPIFAVDLGIHEGRVSIPKVNLRFGLDGKLTIDREAIRIQQAVLTDDTGGRAEITGDLLFNDYKFFTLQLDGQLQNFQVINVGYSEELPFYGTIWASGNLTIDGPLYGAKLRSTDAVTSPESELYIPVVERAVQTDQSYIVFSDSIGLIPDFRKLSRRSFLLAKRPESERRFIDALDLDINILAPVGSTIHLVIDPLLGDVINAESSGAIRLERNQGVFSVFGTMDVSGGDYLFTAGEVFVRRFFIEPGGQITWSGDPINATLDIPASYHTRASRAGLAGIRNDNQGLLPLIVSLQISGTVNTPTVALSLAIDRSNQNVLGDYQAIEAQLNQPERMTEYATSVMLTNSFRLTTDNLSSGSGGELAFNSLSQLVSAQLNRFLNQAIPNVDFSFGLQGDNAQDLDVTYGVALRLLDERLIIRGEGIYQGGSGNFTSGSDNLQGEFVVEVRLSPAVSVELFFRREEDILESTDLTRTAGAGLSYQTEFSTWKNLWKKLFGWITPDKKDNSTVEAPTGTETRRE